ncbi:MAG: type II toxin-antitoxin system VapC family toxin [Thermoanaerobaculales bacterium]
MAAVIYLDTHVVAWLYAGEVGLFPGAVRSLIDSEELLISPIVELELQYLFELQRTTQPGSVVVESLEEEIGLAHCGLPFKQIVTEALTNAWTRDPFDRIIVAQAQVRRTPLLTRDAAIRDHYTEAIWSN